MLGINDDISFLSVDDEPEIFNNEYKGTFDFSCEIEDVDEKMIKKAFRIPIKTRICMRLLNFLFKRIKSDYKLCFETEDGKDIICHYKYLEVE